MLKLYPLFSGSTGNVYFIESNKAKILIDIGVSYKKLLESLNNINKSIDNIDALFITHEHTDHIKGLSTFLKQTNIPVFLSSGTCSILKSKLKLTTNEIDNLNSLKSNKPYKIKDIAVTPFDTSHDAIMPFGYSISSGDNTITIATDLGYVSDNIYKYLSNSKLCVIESNYDSNLLMYGPYNYMLKQRIKSNVGHLSNEYTGNTILKLAKEGNRNFILSHLSKNNNDPDIAYSTITNTLKDNGYNLDEFNISVAKQDFSDEVYIL